jgi:hypothetical protein
MTRFPADSYCGALLGWTRVGLSGEGEPGPRAAGTYFGIARQQSDCVLHRGLVAKEGGG